MKRLSIATALWLAAGAALGQTGGPPGSDEPVRQDLQADAVRRARAADDAYRTAQALAAKDDAAGALRAVDRALVDAPADARLRFLRGVLLARLDRRLDAIEVFERLVADFPELPEPYNNLAALHASAGDLDRARTALEQALRALPDYALARENLGDVHLRLAIRAWELARRAGTPAAAAGTLPVAEKIRLARELADRLAVPAAR